MQESQVPILLGLGLTRGVGPSTISSIMAAYPRLEGVLEATTEELCRTARLSPRTARAVVEREAWDDARREIRLAIKSDAKLTTRLDQDYPKGPGELPDPPPFLFWRGSEVPPRSECVALVGSRRVSPAAIALARSAATELARAGACVVSGGALGVDSAAHRAALEAGGRTTVVLGSGLLDPYPKRNEDLYDRIAGSGGTLLSQFPLRARPEKRNFPIRNRLLPALCRAVLVVRAGPRSGALLTARHAVRQGVPVFALPGRPGDPEAAGPHHLIRTGEARLVESAGELLDTIDGVPFRMPGSQLELGLASGARARAGARAGEADVGPGAGPPPDRTVGLDTDSDTVPGARTPCAARWTGERLEKELGSLPEVCGRIYRALDEVPRHPDQIAELSDLSVQEVTAGLLQLELKHLVMTCTGMQYRLPD